MYTGIIKNIHDWAFARDKEPSPIREAFRTTVRTLLVLLDVFFTTNIPLRASALTYSIILTLVPLLALSAAILKGLGSDNELKIAAHRLIDQITPHAVERPAGEIVPFEPDSAPAAGEPEQIPPRSDQAPPTMIEHLQNGVDMLFAYVEKTNFAALGAFGVVGLMMIVLFMLNEIELTMNAIWHSKKNRPLGRKIMDYLALLLLLPISLNAAFAGEAVLSSPRITHSLTTIFHSPWLVGMLFKGLPFLFIVTSLTFMYRFFPYARVNPSAAFTGALVAALCWFATQRVYITLQIGVSNYNAIYGSFATIPLFLVWLHLGWIFLLLGAALAYAIQNNRVYSPLDDRCPPARQELQLAYDVLSSIRKNFLAHRPTSSDRLARVLHQYPEPEVKEMCSLLVNAGILYSVENEKEELLTPAFPLESLETQRIIELILGKKDTQSSEEKFADKVLASASAAVPPLLFPKEK